MAMIKIKSWCGTSPLAEAHGCMTKTMSLVANVEMGGLGSARVSDIEYDTEARVVWYTINFRNPGTVPLRLFTNSPGVGEPFTEAELAKMKAEAEAAAKEKADQAKGKK